MIRNIQLPQKNLVFVIGILLVLGIFFRFLNINQKLFHGDECITTVRVAGFRHQEVNDLIPRDKTITPEEIKKFQRVHKSGKNLLNTIEVTAEIAPQHTALYFLLTRIWVQIFGDSITVMRTLTAIISLLAFPAIYWLCIELFQSPTVGWIAVALMTVSPVHIIQAQNSRPYSLWILTILLSSAAFLRGIRLNKKSSWFLYGITIVNQAVNPIVISDNDIIFGVMPLNFRLAPDVRLLLISQSKELAIPDDFSDVFLWKPSVKLLSQLEEKQQLSFKPVFQDYDRKGTIWESSSIATMKEIRLKISFGLKIKSAFICGN